MLKTAKLLFMRDIKIGSRAVFKVRITKTLIDAFADLVGDHNPLHTDLEYAKRASFRERVAHGMLVSSFFSRLIGMNLPGKNSLIISQEIKYIKPVFSGDELEIIGVVKKVSRAAKLVDMEIKVRITKRKEVAIVSRNLVLVR